MQFVSGVRRAVAAVEQRWDLQTAQHLLFSVESLVASHSSSVFCERAMKSAEVCTLLVCKRPFDSEELTVVLLPAFRKRKRTLTWRRQPSELQWAGETGRSVAEGRG